MNHHKECNIIQNKLNNIWLVAFNLECKKLKYFKKSIDLFYIYILNKYYNKKYLFISIIIYIDQ